MIKQALRAKIKKLPKGLSYVEAARRLGHEYSSARVALKEMKYPATDGRGQSKTRRQAVLKQFAGADWRMSNIGLALQFGVSREWVRQVREMVGAPFVEARGRKPGGKNSGKISIDKSRKRR